MARTTIVVVEDDLDGGPADKQLTFSLDGADYQIDLNSANADKFRSLLDLYIAAARRTGGRRQRTTTTGATRHTPKDLHEIRQWARANGHTLADRGRVPQSVLDAYATAHN